MTGKRFVKDFRVAPGDHIRLRDFNPTYKGNFQKHEALEKVEELRQKLNDLQQRLFAECKRSLLIILQALDAGGKDGVIKHVIGSMSPDGCHVANFKEPTPKELAHDFLWRVEAQTPEKGQVAIFNRSHYEDVLVVRVHDLVPEAIWRGRYDEINQFEKELVAGGTTLVKVAMFVSLDEQKSRLRERLERRDKYWKYNPSDVDERLLWPAYQDAYQAMLDLTSTDYAPWHVVPCDRKWYSRLAVTELLIDALEKLDLDWPPATFDIDAEKRRLAES